MNRLSSKKQYSILGFILAFVGCLLLYCWFFYTVRYGMELVDESYYLTLPQRILHGDHFLVDEWHFAQFSAFFQVLPYAVYTRSVGSTDGVILFMRYVYLFVSLLSYWYIYYKLREKPIHAALCAFLFCGFVPFAVFTLSYYSLPPIFLLPVCFVFAEERKNHFRMRLFFAGCLFSCAVLMTPGLAIVFLVYCVFVILYQLPTMKKTQAFSQWDFLLNIRQWTWFFCGILFSALCFFVYLQFSSGLDKVFKSLPNLFTDPDYNLSVSGNVRSFFVEKITQVWDFFHPAGILNLLVLFVNIVFFYLIKVKQLYRHKTIIKLVLVLLSFVIFAFSSMVAYQKRKAGEYLIYYSLFPMPILIFGLNCFLLCDQRDYRMQLFWWAGLFYSLAKDSFSRVSAGQGCILAVFPAVFHFDRLLRELVPQMSEAKRSIKKPVEKGLVKTGLIGALVFIIALNVSHVYSEGTCCYAEKIADRLPYSDCNVCVEKGPYKGVFTTQSFSDVYSLYLKDFDLISSISDGPMYVEGIVYFGYLYLDYPNCLYSANWNEQGVASRQILYWTLHPEKRPQVIYVPKYYLFDVFDKDRYYYGQKAFDEISDYVRYEMINGKVGKIYLINEWLI